MGIFTRYICVVLTLMLGYVHATEPRLDDAMKTPAFYENRFSSLSLSVFFPGELEMTDHCMEMLHEFGQTYTSLANCLVSNARPVKVCQNCYSSFNTFQDVYTNISTEVGPGNVSCDVILLRSDRLMLLYNLYKSINDTWTLSNCVSCLSIDQKSVSNTTLGFNEQLNQTLSCFEKYQQGNHSKLCTECRTSYKMLNNLYSNMSNNKGPCIDVEDMMNMTRQLWSKNFKCLSQREENTPVIVVSSFMLFLPLIFYLSNYLHSEQKKRKLMHPKRVKSSHSLANIQDKYN